MGEVGLEVSLERLNQVEVKIIRFNVGKCIQVQKINFLILGWGKFGLIVFCQKNNCDLINYSFYKNYCVMQC